MLITVSGGLAEVDPGAQMKFAYGRGRAFSGAGCLVQCDSIHSTRGSEPDGDTVSSNGTVNDE